MDEIESGVNEINATLAAKRETYRIKVSRPRQDLYQFQVTGDCWFIGLVGKQAYKIDNARIALRNLSSLAR